MAAGDRSARCVAIFWIFGVVQAAAAAAMWWIPWTGYDSQCSLATRNDENIRGACADGAAALMPWFVFLAVTASVLLLLGLVVGRRDRRSGAS